MNRLKIELPEQPSDRRNYILLRGEVCGAVALTEICPEDAETMIREYGWNIVGAALWSKAALQRLSAGPIR